MKAVPDHQPNIKKCTVRLKRINTNAWEEKEANASKNEGREKKPKEVTQYSQKGRKIKPSQKYGTEWVTQIYVDFY